jgi:hypothetical protein
MVEQQPLHLVSVADLERRSWAARCLDCGARLNLSGRGEHHDAAQADEPSREAWLRLSTYRRCSERPTLPAGPAGG